jgi:hypothetical protein
MKARLLMLMLAGALTVGSAPKARAACVYVGDACGGSRRCWSPCSDYVAVFVCSDGTTILRVIGCCC